MSEFKLDSKEKGDVVVITTEGYLNNVGGEKIAEACFEKMKELSVTGQGIGYTCIDDYVYVSHQI